MKLTSRKQLLQEADVELKRILKSFHTTKQLDEDLEGYDLDRKIQKLYQRARNLERLMNTNETSNNNIFEKNKEREEWRNKPVKSKYALKNLPPTTDPKELKRREKMKKWEELNKQLIDSWSDYIDAASMDGVFEDILTKKISGFNQYEIYDAKTLKPIPSKRYPGQIMRWDEWNEQYETNIRNSRKGLKGFLENLLDGLWWSMGS